ncbi:hypothetical protein ACH5Y9_25390 (plasmid) [Methylomonas sp. BW4-1]|uniref:hypothetical protein n=1 Tax=Methylomonas sp. BW4-1 TaxID=3376685 RepID=UPI004041D436
MAIKKREQPGKQVVSDQELSTKIEQFAAGADGGAPIEHAKALELDQNANRDYKAMRVPFNQYEHEQLELGAKLSGRTKLNFMRYAMLKLSKELQEE